MPFAPLGMIKRRLLLHGNPNRYPDGQRLNVSGFKQGCRIAEAEGIWGAAMLQMVSR